MHKAVCLLSVLILGLVGCSKTSTDQGPPVARVDPVKETYFGTTVVDHYRYMENLEDPSVIEWFTGQSEYARSILDRISGRQKLIDQMRELDSRRSSQVDNIRISDNDRHFYLKSTPEDEFSKLYFRESFDAPEQLLYDPLSFDTGSGKKYSILRILPSWDGNYIAFELAADGSEVKTILIMDVDAKELFPVQIDQCTQATSWLPDSSGIFYTKFNSANVHDPQLMLNTKAYLHKLGTDPKMDMEILSADKYPDLGIKPEEIPLVYVDMAIGCTWGFLYTDNFNRKCFITNSEDIQNPKVSWTQFCDREDEIRQIIATRNGTYCLTTKDAPNFKIIKVPLFNPNFEKAITVVSEDPGKVIRNWAMTDDALYFSTLRNGVQVDVYRLSNVSKSVEKLDLPFAAGRASVITKGPRFNDAWINISGWTLQNHRYRYVSTSDTFKDETLSSLAEFPEFEEMIVEELMVPSHDGVKVPLSLIYKPGTKMDGSNPVVLGGYGAYGFSINSFFYPTSGIHMASLQGAISAWAHVRGGGELGESWHMGGFKQTKPNTWKDAIACAEYLIEHKYTSADKIAIRGGSAGGILVGRAITERPDLFAAAIPMVGAMNMLRFEATPNGPSNVPEFGTIKDRDECLSLIEMDAYLHLQEGTHYPATLVLGAMNDPRLIAWQPGKFAARLQAVQEADSPVLFYTNMDSGHGIGDSKTTEFEHEADVTSFALWQTGHPEFVLKD